MYELRQAAGFPQDKVASVLEAIRSERPEHWPYGLTPGHFQDGNLWVLAKSASGDPVGFVGWQEREEHGERVGLYSVGLLPEYRRMGLAKQAVSHVVGGKRASVDRVEALVVKTNEPSKALAQAVGVKVKEARFGPWVKALLTGADDAYMSGLGGFGRSALYGGRSALSGAATAGGMEALYRTLDPDNQHMGSEARNAMLGYNFALGALGPFVRMPGTKGFTGAIPGIAPAALGAVAKDTLLVGQKFMQDTAPQLSRIGQGSKALPAILASLAALGAGGLIYKGLRDSKPEPGENNITMIQPPERGRIRIALPTSNPGDKETVVELPLDTPVLSRSMGSGLERDIRRRIGHELKSRVRTNNRRPINEITHVEA